MALRLRAYLANPSLWHDEAHLALNVLNAGFADLLRPLAENQAAPPLFLWLSKTATYLFGIGELSLRLLPLLAGLLALALLAWLAWRWLAPGAAAVAVLLMAVNERLIYFASEFKQYSSDTAAVLLTLLMLEPLSRPADRPFRRALGLGLAAALLVWLAHPAVFALAGVALALAWRQRHSLHMPAVTLPLVAWVACWLAAFAALYWVQLRPLGGSGELASFWADGYAPTPAPPVVLARWLWDRYVGLFGFPGGLRPLWPAALLLPVGALVLARRSGARAIALVAPLLLTLLAAALRRYPFADRLTLFLLPLAWLLVAAGLAAIVGRLLPARPTLRAVLLAGATLALMWLPLREVSAIARNPLPKQALRPVLQQWRPEVATDDTFYIYTGARAAYLYYDRLLDLPDRPTTFGRSWRTQPERYADDVAQVARPGARVWFIFSHVAITAAGNEQVLILDAAAEQGGQIVRSIHDAYAAAVLVVFE